MRQTQTPLKLQDIAHAKFHHLLWRNSLVQSLLGEFPTSLEARRDDVCAVGNWLAAVDPAARDFDHYETVSALHRQFHIEAGLYREVMHDEGLPRTQYTILLDASEQLVAALDRWSLDLER